MPVGGDQDAPPFESEADATTDVRQPLLVSTPPARPAPSDPRPRILGKVQLFRERKRLVGPADGLEVQVPRGVPARPHRVGAGEIVPGLEALEFADRLVDQTPMGL